MQRTAAGRDMTRQEELFLKRVAIHMVERGQTEMTPENVERAMREVLERDREIVEAFIATQRAGDTIPTPTVQLARAVYDAIRTGS